MIALNFKRLLSRPAATIFFMTVGMIFLSYLLRGESRTKPEHQTPFLSMSLRKLNVVLTASNFKKTFLRIEWKMTEIHLTRCQESHPGMGNRNVFLTMSFLHKIIIIIIKCNEILMSSPKILCSKIRFG